MIKVCQNKQNGGLTNPSNSSKNTRKIVSSARIFLDDFSDEELRSRYRFGRDSIEFLTELENDAKRQTKRNHALSPTLQILVALQFFVSGSFLQPIRDTVGLPKFLCLEGGKRCVAVSRRTASSQARVSQLGRVPWCNWLRRRDPCEDPGTRHERKRFR